MKKIIRNILRAWYGEMMQVFHDQGLIIFCVLVPLAYPLLYSYIYDTEVARNVPVAIVDECHSRFSREYARKVDATSEVAVVYQTDMAGAQELMRREQVYGILRIPSTFDRDIARGRQTYIGYYSDMRCMLYYKSALMAASFVSLDMNGDIKVRNYFRGSTDRQESILRTPVCNDYIPFYNSQSGFASFLIPAVLMLIIQQLLFLSLGMSMGACEEKNSYFSAPLDSLGYRRSLNIVTGKTLFYFPLFLLVAVYMYAGVTSWFSLPCLADYSTFLLFVTPYILACIFLGITLSGFIRHREDAMMVFIFMSVPLLFLSGMSWPVAAEPQFWRYVSWFFPSTFGMHGYVRIMGAGATLREIVFEYCALWIQCAVYFITASLVYSKRASRYNS